MAVSHITENNNNMADRTQNGTSGKSYQKTVREDELRDLGFGSVVARESKQRLLNHDGTFNVQRRGLHFWSSMSLYHSLLTIPWGHFLLLVAAYYAVGNALFAGLYMLCGPGTLQLSNGAPATDFLHAFFFSVQTSSTIGYGHILPVTLQANLLVVLEALFGLLGFALATGLLFARFSRPTARVLFSNRALITPYRGITSFQFRIVNGRSNQLIEVGIQLLLTLIEERDGQKHRRFYNLDLERTKVAFFPLSWTVVHPIDEASPLYGLTANDLEVADAEFLVLLTGIDETFSQTVHARSSYKWYEILRNTKYSNIFIHSGRNGELAIDMNRIHDTEPILQEYEHSK